MVKEFISSLNIRTRLLLLCLGVALPLLAIGCFSICKQYQTLKSEAHRATRFQAAIAARTFSEWVGSQLKASQALARIAKVRAVDLPACKHIFETALETQPEWKELALVTTEGETIQLVTAADVKVTTSSAVLKQKEIIEKVLTTKKSFLTDLTASPWTGTPTLLAITPITTGGDKVQALLVASIDPKSVWSLFEGLAQSSGTVITVVDNQHRVVARTLENQFWQGKDFSQARCVQAAESSERGTLEAVGIADPTPRAYAYDHAPGSKWILIVGVPTRAIYGAAYDWLVSMGILAVSAIGVSVALAYAVTAHFTRAIHCLVREAKAIGKGNFAKRVNVPAKDELGLLARAFNEMAEMLQHDKEHKAMVANISNQIRQSLDLDEILNTTVRELGQHLGASRCCLALLDTHGTPSIFDDELMFNYVWWDPNQNGAPLRNRSILITENSVLSNIMEQGSILSLDVLDESSSTPLFENKDDSPDDWKSIRSLIACPISTNHGPLGMILVHQCDRLRVWGDSELELVEAIAGQVTVALEHARLYDRTRHMAEQEMLINHIVRSVRSSLDLDTILNTVTRELLHALRVDRVQIAQPKSENPLLITHEFTSAGYPSGVGANMYTDSNNLDFRPKSTPDGQATIRNTVLGINLDGLLSGSSTRSDEAPIRDNEPIDQASTMNEAPIAIVHDTAVDSRCMPFQEFLKGIHSKSLIAAPLLHENRLVGLLIVHQCSRTREWKPSDVQLVTSIADQLAIAITHAHLFAQVRHQAITDGLTGLYNHVYFKNRLSEELKLADRKGTTCSLIMIDLDKLKQINDNFGHPVGDAAIRAIASILKTILRSGDTAARYGGEEFAVILPETSLLEAALIADRIRVQIRSCHVPGLGQITASLGAASYPKQANCKEELIENADKALYKAKNNGRDQAQIYEPENVQIEIADFPEEQAIAHSSDEGNTTF